MSNLYKPEETDFLGEAGDRAGYSTPAAFALLAFGSTCAPALGLPALMPTPGQPELDLSPVTRRPLQDTSSSAWRLRTGV